MVKRCIVLFIDLIFIFLYVFIFGGDNIVRSISDASFYCGLINLAIGIVIHLLNKNYFKMLGYRAYYLKRSFQIEKDEKKHVGMPYIKKKILSPYEYENQYILNRSNVIYLIPGIFLLTISLITAFWVMT